MGPRRNTLLDFTDALVATVARHGPPAAVIAHSAGSTATSIAIRDGLAVPRLGFVAPTADPIGRVSEFGRAIGISDRTRERMVRRLEPLVARPLHDFHVPDLAHSAKMPPTLIAHDRADKETPYDDALAIAAAWPDVEVRTTDGLGHQRILRDPDVITGIVDFVAAA